MSRGVKIFRLIVRNLPGTILCKDMLVVAPTKRVVRGFLIETTTEKGRVYLWRVVTPLYRPMSSIILDYSTRIPERGGDVYIDQNAYEKSAEAIRGIILSEGHLDYLKRIREPHDFLRHTAWIRSGSPLRARFDHALTHYLVGNVRQAIEALRRLGTEVDQLDEGRKVYIGPVMKQVLQALDGGPGDLKPLLDQWVSQNIEKFGLQASRPHLAFSVID